MEEEKGRRREVGGVSHIWRVKQCISKSPLKYNGKKKSAREM